MRKILLSCFALAVLASSTPSISAFAAEPSKEDVANAKSLAKEGRELREKGKFKEALVKFEAAYAYVQTPLTGRDLAQEYERDGRLVEARLVWSDVSKMAAKPGDTKEHSDARALAATKVPALEKRIPTILIEITNVPAGATAKVTLDGKDVPAATLGTSRLVNPGSHALSATAEGADGGALTFTVTEGEHDHKVSLALVPKVGPKPADPKPADPPKPGVPSPTPPGPETKKDEPPPPPPPGPARPSEGASVAGGILAVFGTIGILTGGSLLAIGLFNKSSGMTWGGAATLAGGTGMLVVGIVIIANQPSSSGALPSRFAGVPAPGTRPVLAPPRLQLAIGPGSLLLAGAF